MILLTDIPESSAALLAFMPRARADRCACAVTAPRPRALAPSELSAAEARLWTRFGGDRPVSRCEIAVSGPAAQWAYLVVIGDAPASHFDLLREMAAEPAGLPAATACVALRGRGFHGHRGRPWCTEAGNLHLSLACDPGVAAADCGLAMTALPAVATCDALRSSLPGVRGLGIKWVNDLLIDDAKVAGVLTATQALAGLLTAAIFGIGINVGRRPAVAPTLFVPRVTSLQDQPGCERFALPAVLAAVLEAAARRLAELRAHGPEPLLVAYRQASLVIGRRVRIWAEGLPDTDDATRLPPPLAEGVVLSIGADLALTLAGHTPPIDRGRLAFVDPTGKRVGDR